MVLLNLKHGFTLIEILISVSVIFTLSGIAIAGYSNYTVQERLQQTEKTIKNDLSSFQTKAMSGVKPTDCATLLLYTVTFSTTGYVAQPFCELNDGSQVLSGTAQSFSWPAGITVEANPSIINFHVLTGTIDGITDIVVKASDKGYVITIDENGIISETKI